MKMTQENMTRFEDMVRDFADSNNLIYIMRHFWDEGQTEISFKILETFATRVTLVDWKTKKSLSQAGSLVFSYIIREFNLDNLGMSAIPNIKNVIFNDPATIVLWEDGTKTVVKCQEGDTYSKETGLALCIAKKALGNQGNFNEVFKKWIPEEEETLTSGVSLNNPLLLSDLPKDVAEDFIRQLSERMERLLRRPRKGGLEP